jgi:hypothetical protein
MKEEHDISTSYPEIIKKVEEIFNRNHIQAENKRFRIKSLGDEI